MAWTCFDNHVWCFILLCCRSPHLLKVLFPFTLFAFRPCSDFTDVLWHLINCRFIIIMLFSVLPVFLCGSERERREVYRFCLLTRSAACSWRYWFSCLTLHCRMDRVLLTWHQVYHCVLPFLLLTAVTGLVVFLQWSSLTTGWPSCLHWHLLLTF